MKEAIWLLWATAPLFLCTGFDKSPPMAGKAFAAWWTVARPYYSKAYQEVFIGIPIMAYLYYKLSYGGKKAVKDSKSSGHH